MKTQYYTASTLNGFLADSQHSLDWLFQFGEVESMKDHYPRFISEVGALAMGTSTYEWILRQEKLLEHPEKWPSSIPAWIFTHRDLPRRFTKPPLKLVKAEIFDEVYATLTYSVPRQ